MNLTKSQMYRIAHHLQCHANKLREIKLESKIKAKDRDTEMAMKTVKNLMESDGICWNLVESHGI